MHCQEYKEPSELVDKLRRAVGDIEADHIVRQPSLTSSARNGPGQLRRYERAIVAGNARIPSPETVFEYVRFGLFKTTSPHHDVANSKTSPAGACWA